MGQKIKSFVVVIFSIDVVIAVVTALMALAADSDLFISTVVSSVIQLASDAVGLFCLYALGEILDLLLEIKKNTAAINSNIINFCAGKLGDGAKTGTVAVPQSNYNPPARWKCEHCMSDNPSNKNLCRTCGQPRRQ